MLHHFIKKCFFISGACFLTGCAFQDQGIQNKALRDKVIACGAGFSDAALGSLGAAYENYPFNVQANSGFKASAQEIIFSELPPQDRLKAYTDYITCIESNTFLSDKKTSK